MISSESNRTDSINNNAKSHIIDTHRLASSIFSTLITHIYYSPLSAKLWYSILMLVACF